MKRKHFSGQQIVAVLKQGEVGVRVVELYRRLTLREIQEQGTIHLR